MPRIMVSIDQEGAKETKGATVILDGREVYQVYDITMKKI